MKVRALRDCFPADNTFHKAGEVFDYVGPKNEHLAQVKKEAADAEEKEAADEQAESDKLVQLREQLKKAQAAAAAATARAAAAPATQTGN